MLKSNLLLRGVPPHLGKSTSDHGHRSPPSSGKGRGADYAHRPDGFFGNNEWVVEAMAIYNLPILGGEGAVVILAIYHVPSLVNGRGVDHAHTCSFLF